MRTCEKAGCDKKHRARGLCYNHYKRLYRSWKKKKRHYPLLCKHLDCEGKHYAKSLCYNHYNRIRNRVDYYEKRHNKIMKNLTPYKVDEGSIKPFKVDIIRR